MNHTKYNPVPHDRKKAMERIMSTEEGRRAYAAQEEFAIIDAMIEAAETSGLTQAEIARRMGTTQSAISRMLRGNRSPSWKMVNRFFIATGRSVKRIVTEPIGN